MSGGWVMIPLVLLAALIYTNGMQLLLSLNARTAEMGRESEWIEWIHNPQSASGRVGEIIRYTQDNVRHAKQVRNRFTEVKQAMIHTIDRRPHFSQYTCRSRAVDGLIWAP
jgi:biopolymer transport protein ExbB